MKILHVVGSLEFGGLERFVMDLCKYQSKKGHEISILSFSKKNPLFTDGEANIKLFILPKKEGIDFKLIFKILYLIKKNNYDIIHTHNSLANFYLIYYKIFMISTAKLINTNHGTFSNKNEKLYKLSLFFVDKAVFVADFIKLNYVRKKMVEPTKVCTINNGIRFEKNEISFIDKNSLFEGLKKNSFILGTLARLNIEKNQLYLLKIFEYLVEISIEIDFRLLIVGDGPLRVTLKKYAKENKLDKLVIFTGYKNNSHDYLKIFDAFILTSNYEANPLSIIEAMAQGKVIFTTSVGGIGEMIIDGYNGIYLPQKNDRKAAEIILKTAKDYKLCDKLKNNAKIEFKKRYDIEKVVEKYLSLYKDLLIKT